MNPDEYYDISQYILSLFSCVVNYSWFEMKNKSKTKGLLPD